jgi:hypothetical protein
MMRTSVLVLAAVVAATGASADELFLKSGGHLSGRIVNRSATAIEIDIGAGLITVPVSSVTRVVEGRSALQDYEDRARSLADGNADAAKWVELGEWASARGLGTQARQAYGRALALSPTDPRANAALGRVQVGGQWVSEEEGYRARGYVPFEGDWITPAEHEAILRERSSEEAQRRERKEAEARVRAAEERAEEAEKRAKEAEARSQETQGLPLWYGWGAGPVAWPTGPIVVPPVSIDYPVFR